jgi:hypothetical protein
MGHQRVPQQMMVVVQGTVTRCPWTKCLSVHESQHRQPAQAPAIPRSFAVSSSNARSGIFSGPRISRDLKIGTYVKVEADRGAGNCRWKSCR